MKRFLFTLFFAASLIFSCCAYPTAAHEKSTAARFVLNAATNNPKISGQYQGMVILKKLIEERTGGRVMVEIFPDGVLGDEEQIAEKMQSGAVDFTIHSSAKYANFVPEVDIYSPPYTFKNWAHMKAVINSEVNDRLVNAVAERRGDYFVGVFTEGLRNVFSRSELLKLDDLRALRIRTMTGPSEVSAWRALGTNPIPTAYLELHHALKVGAVDGAENTMTSILGMKFYESSKYVLRTGHNYMAMPGILSGRFVRKLPKELATLVVQAAKDSAREQLDWAIEFDLRNERILKEIYGVKIAEFSKDDYAKAISICLNIQLQNAKRIHMEKEQQLISRLARKY
jgi:tripartite ATP-independent transporter DctP family solute receptor